jgi:hypothetical protein
MSPLTRSMTEAARMESMWNNIQNNKHTSFHIIKKEIKLGLSNFKRVKGREYKKYMVYALFDYVCDIKDTLFMYTQFKKFGRSMERALDQFITDAKNNIDTDKDFLHTCTYYKNFLADFIEWCHEIE